MTAFTSEGKKLAFDMHTANQAILPRGSGTTSNSPPKNEQTKSMQKYEQELRFKNRVLKEKEKAIFNKEMLKKLSRNNISMEDLKSE